MTVDEFIQCEIARPFCWGVSDCAATADRWVQVVRGFSPMERYGRQHHDRASALAWLAEPGGIAVAFNRIMRLAAIDRTDSPAPGDLGLVMAGQRVCVAIHAGDLWFSRHEDGFVGAPLSAVWKAWRI